MFLTDSHCHLDMLDLSPYGGDLTELLKIAQQNHVQHILNVSVNLTDFPQVLRTAQAYPFVSASVGVHPNEKTDEVDAAKLISLGQDPKIVAIGETGLDYFRSEGDLEWQRQRFREHIQAAKALNKPLIIHTREAKEDTLRILSEEGAADVGGVMHCFTEDWPTAEKALAMNFYISFSGIVTFRNATYIQDVAKQVPLNRLLIETDAPYLAPQPHRGKSNVPGYVRYTAEYLAELRQEPIELLAEATTDNFFTLFHGAVRSHV